MTAADVRALARSCPEAMESAHMNHPDFRVGGKIFATIGPDATWAMVKLKPAEQASFVRNWPKVFQRFNGAWGRHGSTRVGLAVADESGDRQALGSAWRNVAPKKLTDQLEDACPLLRRLVPTHGHAPARVTR